EMQQAWIVLYDAIQAEMIGAAKSKSEHSTCRQGNRMRRREFIALLGGGALAWPLATQAQPSARPPKLGLLIPGSPASYSQRCAALVQRLRELGWVDGSTIAIEHRWAATQRFAEIVDEFVHSKVDVIFTSGTPPTVAAKRATSEIPIVFAPAGDP